jgi:hypothetical protein
LSLGRSLVVLNEVFLFLLSFSRNMSGIKAYFEKMRIELDACQIAGAPLDVSASLFPVPPPAQLPV